MFLTFSVVFFTNAIGVNNVSCGGSQNSLQESCSFNITNISRSTRTGISTQTYSNFFRFYWFSDVSLFSVLRIRVRRTYDTFNAKRTKVKRNLMCTITCRTTQHLVSSCRSKGWVCVLYVFTIKLYYVVHQQSNTMFLVLLLVKLTAQLIRAHVCCDIVSLNSHINWCNLFFSQEEVLAEQEEMVRYCSGCCY